jgi:hypothetical protein
MLEGHGSKLNSTRKETAALEEGLRTVEDGSSSNPQHTRNSHIKQPKLSLKLSHCCKGGRTTTSQQNSLKGAKLPQKILQQQIASKGVELPQQQQLQKGATAKKGEIRSP